MSFLNPVNEPVMRFSSTDAGAPQINYNARTAGDVKTVLKACLVTGYGAKAGAGWTAVNETASVIEFVSPSAAMSDYRLGIDDTSASRTNWDYQYQDTTQVSARFASNKTYAGLIDANRSGWTLLVTNRAIYFIEIYGSNYFDGVFARIVFYGQVKTANNIINQNIGLWSAGYDSARYNPKVFFRDDSSTGRYYNIDGVTQVFFSSANLPFISRNPTNWGATTVSTIAPLFLHNAGLLLGQQPGLLIKDIVTVDDNIKVSDVMIDGRPHLHVCMSWALGNQVGEIEEARVVLISLDFWEF